MRLHIEASGLVGDRLFVNDKHGVTVAEVHVLARDAAPFIVSAVNAHAELLKLLEASRHCLKSYEYGNAATELAHEIAEKIAEVIRKYGIDVRF
jgi:hypothetical protein